MKKSLGAAPMAYPQVVFMVGSYDEAGVPDVMTAAWGGICSGEPPCVMVAIRPSRKTLENIKATGAFTVGIPSAEHTQIADYLGLESAHKVPNKIEKAGVTAVPAEGVNAPVIEEFKLTMVCKAVNFLELGSHVQVTGEILDVVADEDILGADGGIDIEKLDPIVYDHAAHAYHKVGEKTGDSFSIGLALK